MTKDKLFISQFKQFTEQCGIKVNNRSKELTAGQLVVTINCECQTNLDEIIFPASVIACNKTKINQTIGYAVNYAYLSEFFKHVLSDAIFIKKT
jgi:hypothetical protein